MFFLGMFIVKRSEYMSDTEEETFFPILPAFLLKIRDLDLEQQCGCSCSLGMGKCSPVSVPGLFVLFSHH